MSEDASLAIDSHAWGAVRCVEFVTSCGEVCRLRARRCIRTDVVQFSEFADRAIATQHTWFRMCTHSVLNTHGASLNTMQNLAVWLCFRVRTCRRIELCKCQSRMVFRHVSVIHALVRYCVALKHPATVVWTYLACPNSLIDGLLEHAMDATRFHTHHVAHTQCASLKRVQQHWICVDFLPAGSGQMSPADTPTRRRTCAHSHGFRDNFRLGDAVGT